MFYDEATSQRIYPIDARWLRGIRMNLSRIVYCALAFSFILIISLSQSSVAAARCQISSVSPSLPTQAMPNQQIESSTSVAGSCVSDGEDYYSVRVDLVDSSSGAIISSNSTAIGYNAENFTVTVGNSATTPSYNGTWHLYVNVYVIRAGGTGGSNLLDYRNSTNATIQVGVPTPIPEFPITQSFSIVVALCVASIAIQRRKKQKASVRD